MFTNRPNHSFKYSSTSLLGRPYSSPQKNPYASQLISKIKGVGPVIINVLDLKHTSLVLAHVIIQFS